jgi:hypothetical protein
VDSDKYWASLEDASEFGQALKLAVEDSDKAPITQKVLDEQRNAYLQLFSISLSGGSSSSRITRDGQEGELATFRVPMASALASAVVNLITNQKITWQCTATNSDAASRAQTTLGNQALEYYWHDKGGEQFLRTLVEEGVPFGEAFGFIEFDPMAGDVMAVAPNEQGQLTAQKFAGDARFNVVSSWNVKRDPRSQSYLDTDWIALRLRRNRFDLAARYGPEVLEACAVGSRGILSDSGVSESEKSKSELVDCWYWFHRKTPAVPLGRQAVIIGDKAFALDQLRYRRVPVVRFYTGNLSGTPYPFAPFWTALAAQELNDSLLSTIATNNLTFGHQMISVTAGSEIEPESIGPMRLITVPQGGLEPKAVQLTQSPPEAFKLIEMVDGKQRQLLGLNGTVLGQPEGANLSGAAMSMLASMAIQANSSPQATYAQVAKEAGNILIEVFQDFFDTEHKIRIAGKAQGYMAREAAFTGDAVKNVNNVSVRIANPLSQSVAGREQIFDKYMKVQAESDGRIQIIKTAEDVQQLLDNGRIEGLTDATRDQALLVEAENEALSRGEPVDALLGDDDLYHCKHHRSVVTSVEARKDEALLNNALEHVYKHYMNAFGTDPEMDKTAMPDVYRLNMMTLFGVTAPVTAAPPPGPGAGPGGPPGAGSGPPGASPPPTTPVPEGMPSMPTNPMTGQEFDPTTGGGVVAPPGA